jgi:hypothetical protein
MPDNTLELLIKLGVIGYCSTLFVNGLDFTNDIAPIGYHPLGYPHPLLSYTGPLVLPVWR